MEHDRAPQIEPRADAGDVVGSAGAELEPHERVHVTRENAAGGELVAVSRFGEERFASEPLARELDGFLERQLLERVQRVVMNEDADRPLRRQQVRDVIDRAR